MFLYVTVRSGRRRLGKLKKAYHAHSMETPSRRKMEYSSQEKRGLRALWGSLLSESSSRGS